MKTLATPLFISVAAGIALLGASNAALSDTVSQDLIEARQETQIWTTYALSPYLRASDIKVSVEDGRATLKGKVAEEVNRDLAKQIALGVGGIKSVDNQITVLADYLPAARASDRGYGDVIDDATITATVKSKLMWSLYTDATQINVDSNYPRKSSWTGERVHFFGVPARREEAACSLPATTKQRSWGVKKVCHFARSDLHPNGELRNTQILQHIHSFKGVSKRSTAFSRIMARLA